MESRLSVIAMLVWVAAMPVLAAERCPAPFDRDNLVQVLVDDELDVIYDTYGVYTEMCDGGLYLVDPGDGERLVRINESWWLYHFESARWENADHQAIVVDASYATGIGPTGARPFRARIVLTRTQGANRTISTWTVEEPEFLESDEPQTANEQETDDLQTSEQPVDQSDPSIREVTTPEGFQVLALTDRGRPFEIPVDFSTSRLTLKSLWLTSGSIKVKDVGVRRQDDCYTVFYDLTHPSIGTTDMKQSILYAVLPDDGLPVRFEQSRRFGRSGEPVDGQAAVIDRGDFQGAPPP